jgi:hypothetical protein
MLKLNYTEVGLYMEYVETSLELTIAQRVVLAMRLGQTLHVEPGRASFLLPMQMTALRDLQMLLTQDSHHRVAVTSVDRGYVEVSLQGSWISEGAEADQGMLLTVLGAPLEAMIYKLWQASQMLVSLA